MIILNIVEQSSEGTSALAGLVSLMGISLQCLYPWSHSSLLWLGTGHLGRMTIDDLGPTSKRNDIDRCVGNVYCNIDGTEYVQIYT